MLIEGLIERCKDKSKDKMRRFLAALRMTDIVCCGTGLVIGAEEGDYLFGVDDTYEMLFAVENGE